MGVSLCIPGLVDSDRGTLLFSPTLGWYNIEIGPEITRNLGLPAYVENDVRALALGEQWFGLGRHAESLASSIPSLLNESTQYDLQRLTLPLVFDAVHKGDQLAQSAVEQTITYKAITIANVINTFNPAMVVLSGDLIATGADVVVDRVINLARNHVFGVAARGTPISVSTLGRNGNALGAACLVFQRWLAGS
jgi:predicted NBD/HSP70 family sugar kinase